jgi:16S rRNA (uracil1498-N3)-methyltransferase
MPRFFLDAAQLGGAVVTLTGEDANHAKVLRLRAGDSVTLCDGCGTDYPGVIESLGAGQYTVRLSGGVPSQAEPAVSVTVYMAFAKSDKFEHVLQKATELGAAAIVGFPSARCVSRPDERIAKKLERWQKITRSAAEQSGRGCIPEVRVLPSYAEAVRAAAEAELGLFFYENERTVSIRDAISAQPRSISLMTGPEGGFEAGEVALAEQAGLTVCSLGPRILRCETAPLCALSAVLYATGQI